MTTPYLNESMLDMFIFETAQLMEQLETAILSSEKSSCYTHAAINEIFRIMHTIKGSSAMMRFDAISALAHAIEDLFYFLREEKPRNIDCSELSDLVLKSVDFIKVEMEKVKNGDAVDGEAAPLIKEIKAFLALPAQGNTVSPPADGRPDRDETVLQTGFCRNSLKSFAALSVYKAVLFFEDGCEMENIRAFAVIHHLKGFSEEVFYLPEDITDNDKSAETIRREGFTLYFKSCLPYEKLHDFFMQTVFLKKLELLQLASDNELNRLSLPIQDTAAHISKAPMPGRDKETDDREAQPAAPQQSIISVNVSKLDKLMDLMGEMVIAEAMVIQNPDLKGLQLDNFQKAAWQMNKITGEIQDMVMSIRMLPLTATFHKMHRIVRDMCKRLGKEVKLQIIGEETEVDKNIIEHISDPLMHLIRNSIDHGIEPPEVRLAAGKPSEGTISLEAKNSGSDVLIVVKDDGKGLDKSGILRKARQNKLLSWPESEMSDKEIFSLIFLPGFSTKDSISEYSGRGVGLDVVTKNIEKVGGAVLADSTGGAGTAITMRIPLTLAILDGMNVKVGSSCYTIPIISIRESFRPKEKDIVTDPDGNEMVMVRGRCYPVLRLHRHFGVKAAIREFANGIFIMVESEEKVFCLFADELLGQQQVVIKALPCYIRNSKKITGLAGCTLLGDGSISLILDIAGLVHSQGAGCLP